jgi:hypothetical protein
MLKYHTTMTYEVVKVQLHAFLNSMLDSKRMVKFVDLLLCPLCGGLRQEVRRAPQLVGIETLQVLNN